MRVKTSRLLSAAGVSAFLACSASATDGSKPDLTKDPTLYIVGYAHLDTQWLWMYPIVIRDYLRKTMEDNFRLFDKYPHYTFTFTGSNRYRLMKEYYPDDYAKLKKYISQGRWFPGGSSVEEGDVNSPSLESLVRQVMYGNRYFKKEFGVTSSEYMLPDCFGFPAALPSILAHCGLKGFSTQKLTWGSALGSPSFMDGNPFNVGRWIGPDGKGVVAALNPLSYGSEVRDDLSNDRRWLQRVQRDGQKTGIFADYHYFGTGDVGGAPAEDSVSWAEKSATGNGPLKVVEGTSSQMFDDLTPEDVAKLPTYQGDLELTQHSAGSITSEAEMKRWNHQNEKLAEAAEKADVTAMLLGAADYPTDKLDTAWNWTLTGQFHDMMAGTARPLAYTYEWNDESLAMNYFSAALTGGVGAVARNMDTAGSGIPLVVYNPLSFARTDSVEATVHLGTAEGGVMVTGPDGSQVPTQTLWSKNGDVHFVFLASVPSVGFAVYHASKSPLPEKTTVAGSMIENQHLRVTVDQDGNVSSIYDKDHGTETLSSPIRLAFQAEAPSVYPAWNMDWKDQRKPPYAYVDGPAKVSIVEDGPVRKAIQIERDAQGSHFVQQVRLVDGEDRVEFLDKIDWQTTGCALKATFPLKATNSMATYNWQVGTIQRPNNNEVKYEVASQRWFDVTDVKGGYGCSVLTGAKYGSDKPDDNTVRLTLLYSPTPTGGFEEQAYQDWGHHEILYALYPHASDWKAGKTALQALRLDQPMNVFETGAHTGKLGHVYSGLRISNDDVTAVALKKAEDGGRIIVRLREQNGMPQSGVGLALGEGIVSAREVDGQERPIGPATVQGGKLVFDMGAYAVRAFELQVKTQSFGKTVSRPVTLPFDTAVSSRRENHTTGDFDGQGRSIAADQLPDEVQAEGVTFKIGPKSDDAKNAVSCNGQTIALPSGNWQKVYILAASAKGDRSETFKVGDASKNLLVQDWGGYIGEWDTRVWQHPQKEVIYDWGDNAYEGLTPGFMKMEPVAWCCDHQHDPQGDAIYQYSYLFKYGLELPKGATTLTLPADPTIKVMAVSVAKDVDDALAPVDPLYDTLPRSAPMVEVAPGEGTFSDSVQVSLKPKLFGSLSEIRYSTDGSEPTTAYKGPFWVSSKAIVKARIGDGPITSATVDVNDTTAPKLVSSHYWPSLNRAELKFSEPLDPLAAKEVSNYRIGEATATSAHLSEDGETVLLDLAPTAAPLGPVRATAIVRDASPNHNETTAEYEAQPSAAVYELASADCHGQETTAESDKLPVKGSAPFTINFFLRTDKQIPDHTLIAGFGQVDDDRDGASRYLSVFRDGGLRFWGRDVDISTETNVDLNRWQMLTVTFDGKWLKIYKDAKLLTSAGVHLTDAPSSVHIAPLDGWAHRNRFDSGEIAAFTIWDTNLDESALKALMEKGH
jgi:alpha-mannosidase